MRISGEFGERAGGGFQIRNGGQFSLVVAVKNMHTRLKTGESRQASIRSIKLSGNNPR
jgi:hypothetical protein